MTYRLMIKTHNKTKLKYLCMTKRTNWENYTGSGKYWLNHLKRHGSDISTELLFESDIYSEFLIQCLFYSNLYDVALSEEFANQIPETGYDNSECGYNNFELWWQYATDEMKSIVISNRSKTIKEHHWTKRGNSDGIKSKISDKQISHWAKFSLDERREMTLNIRKKAIEFFDDRHSEKYTEYVKNQSKKLKSYYANTPFEVISEKNRKARLNMSEDAKKKRADKIREVFKTGKHDATFKQMSIDRLGVDNPNAKIVVWYDKKYTLTQFNDYVKLNKLNKSEVNSILDDINVSECYREYDTSQKQYEKLICPHCKAESNPNKLPYGFKKWHFNNCRNKKV